MKIFVTWISPKKSKFALIGFDILGNETVDNLKEGLFELTEVKNDQVK